MSRRLGWSLVLILLLAVVTTIAGGTIALSLYRSAFEHSRQQLVELARNQVQLIRAVARFDAQFSVDDMPGGATEATLSQILEAWRGTPDFFATGEFVLGRRDGADIELLGVAVPGAGAALAADSNLGVPMRLALQGQSGTVTGLDYAGTEVLAAYEFVPELGVGVVAKLDIREVRAPLRRGVLLASGFGIGVIILGGLLALGFARRHERMLQSEQARHRAIFDKSPEGLLVLDGERIEEANEHVCSLLGEPREAILGKSPADFSPSAQADGTSSTVATTERVEAARRGESPSFEWVCSRADGSQLTVEVRLAAIDLDGEPRILAAVRDITERREQEEMRARLLTILQRTSDGVGMADAEGRIFYHNQAMRDLLGIRDQEDASDLEVTDIADPARIQEVMAAAIENGTWEGEAELRRKDGGTVPVSQVVVAHKDERGELRYFSTIARDITERRREEKRIRRLATAIEQISEGIVITDEGGNIEYVNEAFTRITGFERDELIGRNPRILKSGHQDDAFYREMWQTIRSGEVWEGHLINKRKDGSFYEEDMTITPVRGADGAIQSYVSSKRDITDQVLLEAQLRQAQKMEAVGQLAGGVAHDFNNMLTGITGYAQLLSGKLDDEADRADLRQVLELSMRAADLTQQLLAFSRRQQLEKTSVDLTSLAASTLKMLRRLIPEDISVELDGAEGLDAVMADSGQIVQVIMNLAVNARDAMPDGGRLTIKTRNVALDEDYALRHAGTKPGDYALLSIADTGIGMDTETTKHIFGPFFTTKGPGEGTGLGLSTVYGIVRQHGGHIDVSSEVGSGTVLEIYLPAAEAAAPVVDATPPARWDTKLPETATVLLVEDEDAVREIVRRTLSGLGCRVLSAARPSEARRLFFTTAYDVDLLLTDVVMPGGLGTELYAELAAIEPRLRVIFMSGYPLRGHADLTDLPVGTAFLRKPFSPSTLAERIRRILAQEPPHREPMSVPEFER